MLKYKLITKEYFTKNNETILNFISQIWGNNENYKKAKNAINRSLFKENTSFHYLIYKDGILIGLTGYYEIENKLGIFGLNHHGIIPEYRMQGLGKKSLHDILDIIRGKGYKLIEGIIEVIPENHPEIEKIFMNMGFIEYSATATKTLPDIKTLFDEGYYNKAYLLKF